MVSGPYGGSVLQEWYESVRMGDVMVVQLQLEGSLAERKGSYGGDIWRSHTVDLSYTRQSWGVGGVCTFNLGSDTIVFGRLYGLGMPNLCMDSQLDGEWEAVWCMVEIRNGLLKSIRSCTENYCSSTYRVNK